MKVSVLLGHLRENSNTQIVVEQWIEEMKNHGAEVDQFILKDLDIKPCTACWTCQDIFDQPGCPKKDDMTKIYASVQEADIIIFASPIYSWYCTPVMKSVMDRLVYGMNKYYGDEEGPCLWEGKRLGLITTCGYDIEGGAGVYEEGLRRYAKHSRLEYIGKLAIQDLDGKAHFQSEATRAEIKDFAKKQLGNADV